MPALRLSRLCTPSRLPASSVIFPSPRHPHRHSQTPSPHPAIPPNHASTLIPSPHSPPAMNATATAPPPDWEATPSSESNEAGRDRQLMEELATLYKERDAIMSCAEREYADEFADLTETVRKRLQSAADLRDYQLANLRANFDVERQQAWNEFERDKRSLRRDILSVSVDRRRRIDSIRASAVAKKKKRRTTLGERGAKRARSAGNRAFLASLENQGMVRVALTPDEVNNDLALILNGLDSARANGPSRPPVERPADSATRGLDKIHSSRGILHYHDITYEKGDRVSIFAHGRPNGAKLTLRYSGIILSVNSKEIHIKTDDSASHRVYVTHLRNGRFVLKPAGATEVAAS